MGLVISLRVWYDTGEPERGAVTPRGEQGGTNMDRPEMTLIGGNYLMAVCGLVYLAWWIVVFRPPKPRSSVLGTALLILAASMGIVGFYIMGRALTQTVPALRPGIDSRWIVLIAAAAYGVLLAGTVLLFRRIVTSELLIITAWTALELCAVNALYRWGTLTGRGGIVLSGLVLAAAAGSLVCYLLYYRLPYTAGFLDGCVPLALAVLTILLINWTAARSF